MPAKRQSRRTFSVCASTYRRLMLLAEREGVSSSSICERLILGACDAKDVPDPGVDWQSAIQKQRANQVRAAAEHGASIFTF